MTVGHKRIDAMDSLFESIGLWNAHRVRLSPNEKTNPIDK
jgi:hypothetical protein